MQATTPSTASSVGLSRSGLYRATRDGRFTRVARGIYLPDGAPAADWDLIEASTRRADATICLTSALAFHDLIDTIPDTLDVAIPRGSRVPAGEGAIAWHVFDKATFELGRDDVPIEGTELTIGVYSAERCIADGYRLRGRIGYEIPRDALKEWLRRGGKPAVLIRVASQLPRTKTPILRALDALG